MQMQFKKELINREIAGETILVPVGKSVYDANGLFVMNELGAFIWDLLPQVQTEEEICRAVLDEYDAAVTVGQKTTGKGYYQVTYNLSDGSAVAISTGKYRTPKGVSLEGVGITPEVLVEVDEEMDMQIYYNQLTSEEDPQIQAAIDALVQ